MAGRAIKSHVELKEVFVETRKLAVALFIGTAIGLIVALFASPAFWWLGLLAGFAGGYLSVEFRDVLGAIPLAFRAVTGDRYKRALTHAKDWFARPHPFFYPALVLAIPISILGVDMGAVLQYLSEGKTLWAAGGFLLWWFLFVGLVLVISFVILLLADLGVKSEHSYWSEIYILGSDATYGPGDQKELQAKGYRPQPITYGNLPRWIIRGLGVVVWSVTVAVTANVVNLMVDFLRFSGRFTWKMVKLIHSEKRLLCGTDSAIAVGVSYILFAAGATTLVEQVVLVLFGGLLGAALGVANFELVSKRLLHVVPMNA